MGNSPLLTNNPTGNAFELLTEQIQQNHAALLELSSRVGQLLEKKGSAEELEIFKENHSKLTLQMHSFEQIIGEQLKKIKDQQEELIKEKLEELERANASILERHAEMEQQKEALLDQADYLHEANETITAMHAEVQSQKEEILRKNDELLNLNNEKNNLIGIVAHDLKSPLNQVKGLVSIIKMKEATLDQDTMSMIQMIENSIGRLSGMIAKILDVEAIESHSLNLDLEVVNISKVLQEVSQRYEQDAGKKGLRLIEEIQPDVHAKVDRGYMVQIIENLLSNAVKFSPAEKNIYVTLKSEDGQALIIVKDEGPGISKEDQKKLFGKYQKLTAQPTGDETSTGLGLSIVKKFVEAMGGSIRCESELEAGASFIVTFPLASS
jgi:signal transduction histidine kinase